MASVEISKMGPKGIVVVPQAVRELLGVDKGSNVAFVITDDNRVEVRQLEADAIVALDEIGTALREKGITLQDWMREGKKNRRKLLKEMYDIDADNPPTNA